MTYIIAQAKVLKLDRIVNCSILVKDNRIDYISTNMKRLRLMRVNVSNFLLTPGHVMIDFAFPQHQTFQQTKEYFRSKYLAKGCTTILAITHIQYERELPRKLNQLKHLLINSPIDYYVGVKIPLTTLTPSFIRACKRNKVPVVLIEIENESDLIQVPWGWIAESFFSYSLPLIPLWSSKVHSNRLKNTVEMWKNLMKENQIPTIPLCPKENTPLSLDVLKKIGIYPAKGDIRIGGEVDYNLYDLNEISYTVDQRPLVDYHCHMPKITMHKGKFVKISEQIYFHPGFGDECTVKVPGHFASSFDTNEI